MLISLLVAVIVLGLVYWLVMMLPIPDPFRKIAQVIFIIIAIFVVLGVFGFIPRSLWVP